jgi:predicted secreted protein
MSFLSGFLEEFGDQRRRLRRFAKEPRASLIEFTLFAGFVLAALGPIIVAHGYRAAPWGPAVPFLFLAAAVWSYSRLRPNLGGVEEAPARQRHDRVVLAAAIIVSAIGVATFWWAMRNGQPAPDFVPGPLDQLPEAVDTQIVPGPAPN